MFITVRDNEIFRPNQPKAKIRPKEGVVRTQRLRSDPLPFDLRASSTSTLLYTSPYPLRTVLGVALPAISLLFLSINSLARRRSADSRFNRASSWEGGPSGPDVRDPLGGRFQSLPDKEEEVRGEELASSELIDVRGSAFDLRFMSRILCRWMWDVRNLCPLCRNYPRIKWVPLIAVHVIQHPSLPFIRVPRF